MGAPVRLLVREAHPGHQDYHPEHSVEGSPAFQGALGAGFCPRIPAVLPQLIQAGPYRFSRHPIYSGFLLAFVGMALCIGELRAFMGLALLWFSYEIKTRAEERFMAEQFGPAYAQYAARVRKLAPFVY
jgi:protein-S-isoprenylcysteine O-methyltransferase Ste14